ncbi:MAG: methyltransferase family protein [Promethearchaeota archaeon]
MILWTLSAVFGWVPIYSLRKHGGVPEGKSYIHTTILVDSGIYGIVRHPQYLAWILINLAVILIAQDCVILILGIVSSALIYIDIRNADRGCIEKFGDEYKRYIQSVPQMNFLAGIIRMLRRRR